MGYAVRNNIEITIKEKEFKKIIRNKNYYISEFLGEMVKRNRLSVDYKTINAMISGNNSWKLLYAYILAQSLGVKIKDLFEIRRNEFGNDQCENVYAFANSLKEENEYGLETQVYEKAIALFGEFEEMYLESLIEGGGSDDEIIRFINNVNGYGDINVVEGFIKIRNYQKSLLKKIKELYKGVCQICGWSSIEGYGNDISEAHHIEHFSKTQNNSPSNIIILCPTHHRLVHASDAEFHRTEKMFICSNGKKLPLVVNKHI